LEHILNEEAHKLATSFVVQEMHLNKDILPPSSLATLQHNYSLTSNWQHIVTEITHKENLRLTICKNAKWSEAQFQMVDWAAMYNHLKGVSHAYLLKFGKVLHGIVNMNAQHRKYYGNYDICLHCQKSPESFCLVMSCPCAAISSHRMEQQALLWKNLHAIQTPMTILCAIKRGILSCGNQHNTTVELDPSATPHQSQDSSPALVTSLLNQAEVQQTSLGWDQFHKSRLSNLWKEAVFQDSMSRTRWINKNKWQ